MSDTLTGAALVEAAARCCGAQQDENGKIVPSPRAYERARAALRAAAAAAGVDAEELAAASLFMELVTKHDGAQAVARFLRALAEVVRDE